VVRRFLDFIGKGETDDGDDERGGVTEVMTGGGCRRTVMVPAATSATKARPVPDMSRSSASRGLKGNWIFRGIGSGRGYQFLN
jgi:hypothetical protein